VVNGQSVVKSSLQSNGREKGGQRWRERKKSGEARRGEQKLIAHEVTFEEKSEAQVE